MRKPDARADAVGKLLLRAQGVEAGLRNNLLQQVQGCPQLQIVWPTLEVDLNRRVLFLRVFCWLPVLMVPSWMAKDLQVDVLHNAALKGLSQSTRLPAKYSGTSVCCRHVQRMLVQNECQPESPTASLPSIASMQVVNAQLNKL